MTELWPLAIMVGLPALLLWLWKTDEDEPGADEHDDAEV
jgi:hypothetical protein